MRNIRLREALNAAGLKPQHIAADLGVDPKTVERWITQSRLPYPRYRARLARMLGQSESYLWPQASSRERPRDGDGPARDVQAPMPSPEVPCVYPRRVSVPTSLWHRLLFSATRRLDILTSSGLFLLEQQPHLLQVLRERATAGLHIRLLLGDPDSTAVLERGREEGRDDAMAGEIRSALTHYRALADHPRIEVRLHGTTLYASVIQSDDEMLVNPHIYGVPEAHAPVLHLHRVGPGDLFESYIKSFELVWQDAVPVWSPQAAVQAELAIRDL